MFKVFWVFVPWLDLKNVVSSCFSSLTPCRAKKNLNKEVIGRQMEMFQMFCTDGKGKLSYDMQEIKYNIQRKKTMILMILAECLH